MKKAYVTLSWSRNPSSCVARRPREVGAALDDANSHDDVVWNEGESPRGATGPIHDCNSQGV